MTRENLEKIKSFESAPKILNIFSEQETKMMQDLYQDLPLRVFNKKQNVKKKMWLKKYNLNLEKVYKLTIWNPMPSCDSCDFRISTIFHYLLYSKLILKQVYFLLITSTTNTLLLIAAFPNLLNTFFLVLQLYANFSFLVKIPSFSQK